MYSVVLGASTSLGRLYGTPHKPNIVRRVRRSRVSILGNPDVWRSNLEVGSRSRANKVRLVCPSYGHDVSTRHFKFWVTWIYDVAVALKFMQLDCLS